MKSLIEFGKTFFFFFFEFVYCKILHWIKKFQVEEGEGGGRGR